MQDDFLCIEVILLTGVPRPLAYLAPDNICVGDLVKVPLKEREVIGIVIKTDIKPDCSITRVKSIIGVLHELPILSEELLKLARWLHQYYAVNLESVFEVMIPSVVRQGMKPKMNKCIAIKKELELEEYKKFSRRSPKQALLYDYLFIKDNKPISQQDAFKLLNVSRHAVKDMINKGILEVVTEQGDRTAYEDSFSKAEKIEEKEYNLTSEQEVAFKDVCESIEQNQFQVHLLHGVTGSGKTEVYLRAIDEVIKRGGGVIFLVPEVALTPQTVGRLRSRFEKIGVETVVWHSQLSDGERYDGWMKIIRGDARLVVGARSAVFAPVENLKLVIVDEEHESTYKQNDTPRYHGRDVAVYRSMISDAVCILGSATPSLESLKNVSTGKYKLNQLTKRIDNRKLPDIQIVDMRPELRRMKSQPVFSLALIDKLRDRFEKKEQTILFINRRGFSTKQLCPECNNIALCKHCSVSLTYHKTEEQLRCHVCNYHQEAISKCLVCHAENVIMKGFGTQRVEEVVKKILPQARVARMDTDTMSKKNQFREILSEFRKGNIDVLIGTQMIAKGLDFPNVTLVGLIDADISLHVQDFRANERTFQLVVQVAGRAGRGEKSGEVVVQSYLPCSSSIQYAKKADFEGFLNEEMKQREELMYPPYRSIIRQIFRGRDLKKVEKYAMRWAGYLDKHLSGLVEIKGPAPAPLEKVKDNYRYHILIFTSQLQKILPKLLELKAEFRGSKDVIDVFDVDPVDLN